MSANLILADIDNILLRGKRPDPCCRQSVISHLTFLYHTMKASENMLQLAKERSKGDPLLEPYFTKHLEEERGHEAWLAKDLEDAGAAIEGSAIPIQAALLCGSVYYHLFHGDPAALLGYMLLAEGRPLGFQQLETLENIHGKELFRTLRYHVEHDVQHAEELKAVVDSLPLARLQLVHEIAKNSAYLFSSALSLIAHLERT